MSALRDIESVAQIVEQIANDVSNLAPAPVGAVAGLLALGARAVEEVLVALDDEKLAEDEIVAAVRTARVAKARKELEAEET